MGQSQPLFVYFCSFLVTISIQIEKSVDGALRIRTWDCNMVGADETMGLLRPQQCAEFKHMLQSNAPASFKARMEIEESAVDDWDRYKATFLEFFKLKGMA